MANSKEILSVGIDIGTTTTQVIFSRLGMENTASYFAIPHVSIISKEVVYKSDIYMTPLKTPSLIDADQVKAIVESEFAKAGYTPSDTQTGAVIITGESARKENASLVLEKLSGFAGDFVVSTAGPDLESILAGKGSGAQQYSKEYNCTVANLDIGGGTTNIVVFDNGDVVTKGCLDIGGRLIRLAPNGALDYISRSVALVAAWKGVHINENEMPQRESLERICEGMAQLLEQALGLCEATALLNEVQTKGSSFLQIEKPIHSIFFSGGVADYIYGDEEDYLKYGDIGILLGRAIRHGKLGTSFSMIKPKETIRATVVGAGTYTTSISGSTITYAKDLLPLKNIPALKLTSAEEEDCFGGDWRKASAHVSWFKEQSASEKIVIVIKGKSNPTYLELKALARSFVKVAEENLGEQEPFIVIIREDMAKALGQALLDLFKVRRNIISLDAIHADDGDYLDIGRPFMDGLVIPVVVKTLIFG
ncbi:MAG: ethanolamine ammonia-lyase reactivating factor EutA [Clostridia bacterium]|nr:ethanolamine ammonia-lyase reactivating factor EutA [Clostridia bacterium]